MGADNGTSGGLFSRVTSQFHPWIEGVLGLFYPSVCQICEREPATPAQGYVGPECYKKVQFITPPFCSRCGLPFEGAITAEFTCSDCRKAPPAFVSARAAVKANQLMLDVIHRYKYNRCLYFEAFLAGLLVKTAQEILRPCDWDFIVPVPLHPTKKREREFNQAERIARHLSRATSIPLNTRLIQRVEPTQSQTTLDRKERSENVRRAFAPGRRAKLTGQRIILLDDVLTTGATTNACTQTLLRLGASQVCVWAVARGV